MPNAFLRFRTSRNRVIYQYNWTKINNYFIPCILFIVREIYKFKHWCHHPVLSSRSCQDTSLALWPSHYMHISSFHSDSSSGSFGSNSMNSSKKSMSSLKHAPTHVCGEYLGMDESGCLGTCSGFLVNRSIKRKHFVHQKM